MGRIPQDEVERLKREVSIERLAVAAGIELKRHGADLHGCCPFHDDKSPSLVISPEKNLWNCLGACQAGGSVLDWVMKSQGVSFRHAVELLREAHPSLAEISKTRHSTVKKLPAPVTSEADDRALLLQVVGYYQETLKQSPEALAYLQKRGIDSAEAIETFKLGFADRTLGYRLPAKNRSAGAAIRGRLVTLGLYRESGHEHFNGSLIIPVFDETGAVSEIYGRKVTEHLRAGTPLHLYLPGPHRGVWNEAALASRSEVILCEALIDALTFWCAGFRHVTASYGVSGFTDDHLAAFKKHGTKRVLIAYDRDEAGDSAAEKLAQTLMSEGIECFRVQFPKGMDANDYALKVAPAKKSLGLALRHAVWMGSGAAPMRSDLHAEPTEHPIAPPPIAETPGELPSLAADPVAEPDEASSPIAAAPAAPPITLDLHDEELRCTLGDRRYRVRGLDKNLSFDALRINVLVGRGDAFYVDTFDLYQARQRTAYTKQAAIELGIEEAVLKRDLSKLLLALEERQDKRIKETLTPVEQVPQMSEREREAAMTLLRDPHLLDRVLEDFARCGVVGEETNKLVGYLAAVSRKLEQPLAVIIQSTSAAGKSSLMEAVLQFMPQEDRIKFSAMTGQSLFYMGETNLKHKILAIVEEEGAEKAAYALKLLQSEGELTIASTGKDPETGRHITHEYRVEGPVMIFLTSTAIEIDEELLNRCLVLTVDEGREQTRAIHAAQRFSKTLEGLLNRAERNDILAVHRNAHRLLKPLLVANPYAQRLTFVDHQTRTRRDHTKYLTLIQTIALLHQHQRELKRTSRGGKLYEYIEVSAEDIRIANKLAHAILGRSLDALPPQTRRFLLMLDEMAIKVCADNGIERIDYRFSRREAREHGGFGYTQTKVHLERLVELEYVGVHRSVRGQDTLYELRYDGGGKDGTQFLMGLIEPDALDGEAETHAYDARIAGQTPRSAAPLRSENGPSTGPVRTPSITTNPSPDAILTASADAEPQDSHQAAHIKTYVLHRTEQAAR